jgi:hypothetical protein
MKYPKILKDALPGLCNGLMPFGRYQLRFERAKGRLSKGVVVMVAITALILQGVTQYKHFF